MLFVLYLTLPMYLLQTLFKLFKRKKWPVISIIAEKSRLTKGKILLCLLISRILTPYHHSKLHEINSQMWN